MEQSNQGADFDPDKDKYGLGKLFTDTDYQEIVFTHNECEQKLQALKGASTDFDLTGQIVWQAANIFSQYMLEKSETQ